MIYLNNIVLVCLSGLLILNKKIFCFLAEEIANAISSPIGSSDLYNDADLERELELLAEEEIKKDMMKIGPLPDVPNQTAATIKTDNQPDELRELEAWAQ